jgi:hypothetical protein
MASCLWGDVAGMQPAPLMRSSSRLRRAREWRLPTVTDGRGAEPWVRCRGAETADRPRATCIRAASGWRRSGRTVRDRAADASAEVEAWIGSTSHGPEPDLDRGPLVVLWALLG